MTISPRANATGLQNVVAIAVGEAHSLAIVSTTGPAPSTLPGLPATGGGAAHQPNLAPWLLVALPLLLPLARGTKFHRRAASAPE